MGDPKYNTVLATGSGSLFQLTDNYFAINGVGNQFTVSNGASAVFINHLNLAAASSTGIILRVTGNGSSLTSGFGGTAPNVGGVESQFVAENGATASFAGFLTSDSRGNSQIRVDGPGSVVTATADVLLKDNGRGSLAIRGGAAPTDPVAASFMGASAKLLPGICA